MIYYRLSGLLLLYVLYIVLFIIVSLYAHTCNILCTLFSYFIYSLGVFWLSWICTSRSMYILFCWSGIWRESHVLRGAQTYSFDLLILSIVLSLFFIPCFIYSILYIVWTILYSIWLNNVIMCKNLYVILQC